MTAKGFRNAGGEDYAKLKAVDFAHLWHPFTNTAQWFADSPVVIEWGSGAELFDINGNGYLDGSASLWCNVHGHGVPEIVEAIQHQATKLCHSTLLGLTHTPILDLTESLVGFLPNSLERVFYCDSGTAAVEAGLRMAMEWWQKQGTEAGQKRTRYASLVESYHGDTLGSVGVGYLPHFHRSLNSIVTQALRVSPPHVYRFQQGMSEEHALSASIDELKSFFSREANSLAAFIIEPLVQGAAGIWTHDKAYLQEVARLCKEHEVFLIVDEVATGFGKTGKMFAIEHAEVEPDILILGKGLSGGYLPISAAVATEQIFQGFSGETPERTFFYGQTFAGNPLAASAALANLQLFMGRTFFTDLEARIAHFTHEVAALSHLAHVDEVRQLGLMVGVEFTSVPGSRVPFETSAFFGNRVSQKARELGALIRPIDNVLVLMPPLAMTSTQLSQLVEITAQAIVEAVGS